MPQVFTVIDPSTVIPPTGPEITRDGNHVDVVVTTYTFCKVTTSVIERDSEGLAVKWKTVVEDV